MVPRCDRVTSKWEENVHGRQAAVISPNRAADNNSSKARKSQANADAAGSPLETPFQTLTVTRRKVAGMEVAACLLFWLLNSSSNSSCNSAALPFFSAASNAFMVGP